MLFVSVDKNLLSVLFLIFIVGWAIFKIIDVISNNSNSRVDARPRCAKCGELLPSNTRTCISCGYTSEPKTPGPQS